MQGGEQLQINGLPEAEGAALEHSRRLQALISDEINNHDGLISFSRFMQMALYEPGLGYYSAGARKFGEAGDFVTAPEISSLFSICLARQCMQVIGELNDPVLLEVGAGSGTMAADILLYLQELDCLPAQYWILETSADLRQRQQAHLEDRLPGFYPKIRWLDAIPSESFEGVILANEVLDALPVRRFRIEDSSVLEIGVTCREDKFTTLSYSAEEEFEGKVRSLLEQGLCGEHPAYESELNDELDEWLLALVEPLGRGIALFIDYGYPAREYYHEQRSQGSLLCHYRHRAHHDPLINIGLQDITASVNFTVLAEAALKANLEVKGYTTQAFFLLGCGLEQVLNSYQGDDQRQQVEYARQVKLLTLPAEMGERFKVMALGRDMDLDLTGFGIVDHRGKL